MRCTQGSVLQSCNVYFLFLYLSFIIYEEKNVDKVEELVGGGSVINGAYPVQFLTLLPLFKPRKHLNILTTLYLVGSALYIIVQNCKSKQSRVTASNLDFSQRFICLVSPPWVNGWRIQLWPLFVTFDNRRRTDWS